VNFILCLVSTPFPFSKFTQKGIVIYFQFSPLCQQNFDAFDSSIVAPIRFSRMDIGAPGRAIIDSFSPRCSITTAGNIFDKMHHAVIYTPFRGEIFSHKNACQQRRVSLGCTVRWIKTHWRSESEFYFIASSPDPAQHILLRTCVLPRVIDGPLAGSVCRLFPSCEYTAHNAFTHRASQEWMCEDRILIHIWGKKLRRRPRALWRFVRQWMCVKLKIIRVE